MKGYKVMLQEALREMGLAPWEWRLLGLSMLRDLYLREHKGGAGGYALNLVEKASACELLRLREQAMWRELRKETPDQAMLELQRAEHKRVRALTVGGYGVDFNESCFVRRSAVSVLRTLTEVDGPQHLGVVWAHDTVWRLVYAWCRRHKPNAELAVMYCSTETVLSAVDCALCVAGPRGVVPTFRADACVRGLALEAAGGDRAARMVLMDALSDAGPAAAPILAHLEADEQRRCATRFCWAYRACLGATG